MMMAGTKGVDGLDTMDQCRRNTMNVEEYHGR